MSQLSASAIAAALTTHRLGRPALFFAQIGSTNDEAHAQAVAGARDGLLVVADEQTAGRGRLDRRWWSPPGSSLLLSLLLRPPIPLAAAGGLTMCLGLGAAEGIERVTGLRPALKWPNDLLLDGRKLGGMLTELRADGERLAWAVLGLGVNVNVAFDGGPTTDDRRRTTDDGRRTTDDGRRTTDDGGRTTDDRRPTTDDAGQAVNGRRSAVSGRPSAVGNQALATTATSLSLALGWPVDRLLLLATILARTEIWYERLLAGESPHEAWAARLDTLGRSVIAHTPAGAVRGVAVGVTPEGGLLVRDADGRLQTVWAGDVTALRAAQ